VKHHYGDQRGCHGDRAAGEGAGEHDRKHQKELELVVVTPKG
jgi:hypothetical protein